MTNLINQIFINGEKTTYLNYATPLISIVNCGRSPLYDLFETQLGHKGGMWNDNNSGSYPHVFKFRFPVPWETLTADIPYVNEVAAGFRASISFYQYANNIGINTTNSTSTNTRINNMPPYMSSSVWNTRIIGVINNYCLILACTSSDSRSSISSWIYTGWAKDGQFVGPAYPRNYLCRSNGGTSGFDSEPAMIRVNQENTTATRNLLIQNPSPNYVNPLPNADSTDVIIRDAAAPNNYVGKLWNMMILPNETIPGRIYRNEGPDPDTGQIETDQKAFWLCLGNWGTNKIGMRFWTEGII